MNQEKKEWTEPSLTEFDVAERTENNPGDGPDGAIGDPDPS